MVNLSRLEEIKDLRAIWPHESLDFTPWLSQDDNIAILADAIGLDITVEETESSVGDFNVDIFALETGTDRKIIIEKTVNLGDKNQWNDQFDWLTEVMIKMKRAFKNYL